MEIKAMNCPNCAGSITFAVGQRTARCPYCDSTLEIKPEAAEVTLEKTKRAYRNISDTRAEYARRVKKWKIISWVYYVVVFVMMAIGSVIIERTYEDSDAYDFGMTLIVMALISGFAMPPILTCIVPRAPEEVEEPLRLQGGWMRYIKLTGLAVMTVLAGFLAGYVIFNSMTPSEAQLEREAASSGYAAVVTVTESEV